MVTTVEKFHVLNGISREELKSQLEALGNSPHYDEVLKPDDHLFTETLSSLIERGDKNAEIETDRRHLSIRVIIAHFERLCKIINDLPNELDKDDALASCGIIFA